MGVSFGWCSGSTVSTPDWRTSAVGRGIPDVELRPARECVAEAILDSQEVRVEARALQGLEWQRRNQASRGERHVGRQHVLRQAHRGHGERVRSGSADRRELLRVRRADGPVLRCSGNDGDRRNLQRERAPRFRVQSVLQDEIKRVIAGRGRRTHQPLPRIDIGEHGRPRAVPCTRTIPLAASRRRPRCRAAARHSVRPMLAS